MGMQQTGLALLALAACVAFRPSEAPGRAARDAETRHLELRGRGGGPAGGRRCLRFPGFAAEEQARAARRPWASILPIASSCCTEVSHHISRRLLERVATCRIQRADGDCDLAAVILHVKRRRVCVSPHNHIIKQWMKEQAAKKEAQGNICHKKRHHARRNSKGPHRERQETHGHKTPY